MLSYVKLSLKIYYNDAFPNYVKLVTAEVNKFVNFLKKIWFIF